MKQKEIAFSGYDIIILGGQANADGFGLTNTPQEYDDRIEIIEDENLISIYGNTNIDYNYFHNDLYPARIIQNKVYERKENNFYKGCFAYKFASEYVKYGLLKEGRKLLIVKAAVGGTSFLRKQWGNCCALENRLFQMVDYAFKLNGNNKIIAMLWHQGESDTDLFDLRPERRYISYFNGLFSLFIKIREHYKLEDLPIICGEMLTDFIDYYGESANAVTRATRDVCNRIPYASMVSSKGLVSNKREVNVDDTVHFSYNSLVELGRRYFIAYLSICIEKEKERGK